MLGCLISHEKPVERVEGVDHGPEGCSPLLISPESIVLQRPVRQVGTSHGTAQSWHGNSHAMVKQQHVRMLLQRQGWGVQHRVQQLSLQSWSDESRTSCALSDHISCLQEQPHDFLLETMAHMECLGDGTRRKAQEEALVDDEPADLGVEGGWHFDRSPGTLCRCDPLDPLDPRVLQDPPDPT